MLLILTTALLLVGCKERNEAGTEAEKPSLSGITRTPAPSVEHVILPDVSPTANGGEPRPFRTKAAQGELLIVYFGYTSCPDVCPTSMSDLKSAKRDLGPLGDQITVAMITVDPQRDTPDVLNSYLSHFFTRYHALRTEDTVTLKSAESAFGASSSITAREDGSYDVSHTGSAYAVDSNGKIVVEWPFGTNSNQIATDIRIMMA